MAGMEEETWAKPDTRAMAETKARAWRFLDVVAAFLRTRDIKTGAARSAHTDVGELVHEFARCAVGDFLQCVVTGFCLRRTNAGVLHRSYRG